MKKTVKTRKTTRKTSKRRQKVRYSDAIRAFILVGVLVAVSALISCAVIMVHSNVNNVSKDDVALQKEEEADMSIKSSIDQMSPIVVSIEPLSATEFSAQDAAQLSTQNVIPDTKPEPKAAADKAKPVPQPKTKPSENSTPVITTVAARIEPKQPKEIIGNLVFVIDDAGNNLKDLDAFLKIPGPLTIAVMPGLPHSAESAKRIREAGKEVILHQPMEAIGGQNPGPGAIYSGQSAAEIREILARNIAEVGPIVGINNHQGSKVTMDMDAMQTILAFCKEKKIFFLDSRTTADTVAPAIAKQMNIKIAERNIFIDNEQNKDSMLRYITGGLTRAKTNGSAILIGHTWSPDLAPLLREQYPVFMEQGFAIKSVSEILKQ